MIINIVRWSGVLVGASLTTLTTVALPFGLVKETIDLLHEQLPWKRLTVDTPELLQSFSLFGHDVPAQLINLNLPSQLSWQWVMNYSVLSLAPFMIALVLLHFFIPAQSRISSAFGVKAEPAAGSYLDNYVQSLVKANNGPRASVFVLPFPTIQAYAMHSPLKGGLILVSHGAIEHLSAKEMQWVLAHEYGHVKNKDYKSATFWLLSQRGIRVFDVFRHRVANFTLRLLHRMPILNILSFPAFMVIKLLSLCGRMGQKVGATFHLIFDRFSGRMAELKADEFAAKSVSVNVGISLFNKLRGELEPTFNGIFATHPTFSKRIDNLKAMTTKGKVEGK